MALDRDTVAIPFMSGIQPSMRARLLPAEKLQTAQNCAFILDAGPQKRNGHVSHQVRTSGAYVGLNGLEPPTAIPNRALFDASDPGIPRSWTYGYGVTDPDAFSSSVDPFEVSPQPDVGVLLGQTSRDNEILTWDGFRAFSYAPNQTSLFGETQAGATAAATRGPATIPMLRAAPIAKAAESQLIPDCADNGQMRVVAWLSSDNTNVFYSAYDSLNGAALVVASKIIGQTPKSVRVISTGPWFHILFADSTANSLEVRSFHQETPNLLISRNLSTVDSVFDVKKISESKFVVLKSKGGFLTIYNMEVDGSNSSAIVPDLGGFAATTNRPIALGVDSVGNLGLLWTTTGAPDVINFQTVTVGNAPVTVRQQVTTATTCRRLTLAARQLRRTFTGFVWDVFVEDLASSIAEVRSFAVITGGAVTTTATRFRTMLGSHAFKVGNRSFVWCAGWMTGASGFQNTWFLCDSAVLPVGSVDYGQANLDFSATNSNLPSVNFRFAAPTQPTKDVVVFHGALPFNVRVDTAALVGLNGASSPTPTGVFAETSIRFYQLDFLPPLRAAQAGRSTYLAGAQLWAYDGAEVVEAGFLMAPEGTTYTPIGSGGAMSAGVVRYRIDLCHKNSQNEEVRSWSLISNAVTVVANDRVTIAVPQMPMTRREDSYFLIFRTVANGTVYFLANSRDPLSANFLKNNPASPTLTFVDSLADASLAIREYHPANAGGNYLDPLPAPPCELVSAGRDRLWLAGGMLASGEVAPSRLFFPGQSPSFSPGLNIQVDRNAEPISAIGFLSDIAVVFRKTATYIIDSDGPDNSLQGAWQPPRLAIADTGAVGPESLALTVSGLWFQSPAGIRLLGNSGNMDPKAGQDVDLLAVGAVYSAAVVVPQYTQVRWYSKDFLQPTLVLDYSSNSWSTWTGLTCTGASFWPTIDLAVLTRGDGSLWVETVGVFSDSGFPYEMIVKTAPLHGKSLGDFQRVRRFALFGEGADPMTLRARIFYDERPFYEEELIRTFQTPTGDGSTNFFNNSIWGGNANNAPKWGNFSIWGDQDNQTTSTGDSLFLRDRVFRFRYRPRRQKCSVFAVEFSDLGATTGGFTPIVLALELGIKSGLDRIPTATNQS